MTVPAASRIHSPRPTSPSARTALGGSVTVRGTSTPRVSHHCVGPRVATAVPSGCPPSAARRRQTATTVKPAAPKGTVARVPAVWRCTTGTPAIRSMAPPSRLADGSVQWQPAPLRSAQRRTRPLATAAWVPALSRKRDPASRASSQQRGAGTPAGRGRGAGATTLAVPSGGPTRGDRTSVTTSHLVRWAARTASSCSWVSRASHTRNSGRLTAHPAPRVSAVPEGTGRGPTPCVRWGTGTPSTQTVRVPAPAASWRTASCRHWPRKGTSHGTPAATPSRGPPLAATADAGTAPPLGSPRVRPTAGLARSVMGPCPRTSP